MIGNLSAYSACRVASGDLRAWFQPLTSVAELESLWLELERRSDCSFFQSWAWIGSWLWLLPESLDLWVLVLRAARELVGLGILVGCQESRYGLMRVHGLYLNETGDPRIDPLGLEYNGVLTDRRVGKSVVAHCCLTRLAQQEFVWDELSLGGLNGALATAWAEAAGQIGLNVWVRAKKQCNYVDLTAMRRKAGSYLGFLSHNTPPLAGGPLRGGC